MFNSYYGGNYSCTNSVRINAVTGAILKNHPKSWFERFHLTSDRAKSLFKEGGHKATKEVWHSDPTSLYGRGHYTNEPAPEKDITILQMVICGDMEVMAELVYTKDYNYIIENQEVNVNEMDKK